MPNLCADRVLGTVPVGLNVCFESGGHSSRSQSFIVESAPPDIRLL